MEGTKEYSMYHTYTLQTGHGDRIGRAQVSRAGDRGFKPQLSQTNDLSN